MNEICFLMESNAKDMAGDIFYTKCKSFEEAQSMAKSSTMKSAEACKLSDFDEEDQENILDALGRVRQ